jgi:LysM repeat protein
MSLTKAYLQPERGRPLPCLFNPSRFTVTKANHWIADRVAGRAAPNLYFAGGGAASLDLSLCFDTTSIGRPVTTYTQRLLGLMDVDPTLPGHDPKSGRGRPPWVRFHWGDYHSFKAVVADLSVTLTYFASDGTPLRADADLTLRQLTSELPTARQNPTSGTPEPEALHRVQPGETLDRIAASHYGDAQRWRDVAAANDIVDPLELIPGTMLTLPVAEGGRRA